MVGSDLGKVQLWDASTQKQLRVLTTHKQRVGVGAWAGPILATGSKDKSIHLHDVRSRSKFEHKLQCHTHEVSGVHGKGKHGDCTRRARAMPSTHPHPSPPP